MKMNYEAIIVNALTELVHAASTLNWDTSVPLPRVRRFEIVPGITWPGAKDPRLVRTGDMTRVIISGMSVDFCHISNRKYAAHVILKGCCHQPRLVLRALRRIQTITAWCKARTEGCKRHAEEIVRQQAHAVKVLEAEAAMLSLEE